MKIKYDGFSQKLEVTQESPAPSKVENNLFSAYPASARLMSFTQYYHRQWRIYLRHRTPIPVAERLPNICHSKRSICETVQPSEMGNLPPYKLPTVVINEMDNTPLLSVSQACKEGICGIFTAVDCNSTTSNPSCYSLGWSVRTATRLWEGQ